MDIQELQKEITRLRRANTELTFLHDLAQATSLLSNFETLIRTIVGKAIRAVHAEQGAVVLLEGDTGAGRTLARSIATSESEIAYGLDQMLLGWMTVHKEPLNLDDPMGDKRFKGVRWDESVRSLACVPLLVQSDLIGAIAVFNKKDANAFSDDDIRLLTIIAGQSSQVIENARLHGVERLHEMLKLTQAQLIESKKMASLGSLVAGLLHEINNPLGSILSSGDVVTKCVVKIAALLDSGGSPDEIKKELDRYVDTMTKAGNSTQQAIDHVQRVFGSLKSLAGVDQSEVQDVDINVKIEDVLTLLERELAGRVDIVRDFGKLPRVRCRAVEIGQVLMHLLSNASQAIDTRGRITIRTLCDRDYVTIAIADNGRGIPESRMRHIYDPTFNKSGGKMKAGLGLFICSNIIHKHRGTIDVSSELDGGTTVTVSLPVAFNPA